MVITCHRSKSAPNFPVSSRRKIASKSSNAPMTRTFRNACAVCSVTDTSACTSLKYWNPTDRPTINRNRDTTISHRSHVTHFNRWLNASWTETVTDFVWSAYSVSAVYSFRRRSKIVLFHWGLVRSASVMSILKRRFLWIYWMNEETEAGGVASVKLCYLVNLFVSFCVLFWRFSLQ